jgi:hypothetical protein
VDLSHTVLLQQKLPDWEVILEFQEKFLWANIYANTCTVFPWSPWTFKGFLGPLKALSNGKGGVLKWVQSIYYLTFVFISAELLKIAL